MDLSRLNDPDAGIGKRTDELDECRWRWVSDGVENEEQIARVPTGKTVLAATRSKVLAKELIGDCTQSIRCRVVQRVHVVRTDHGSRSTVSQCPLDRGRRGPQRSPYRAAASKPPSKRQICLRSVPNSTVCTPSSRSDPFDDIGRILLGCPDGAEDVSDSVYELWTGLPGDVKLHRAGQAALDGERS